MQYGCWTKDSGVDIGLFKFFLNEYRKYRPLSDKEIKFIPDILTAGAIDDFHYQYWLFVHDPSRAKLNWLKAGSKKAEWSDKNKEKIVYTLLNKRKV